MCRYIIDPQNEGVLLPTKGTEANMHQQRYKISSHVQAFMRQFAQWRSERQFEAAGPWRLLKASNSKLEVSCKQGDMTGGAMFQAMYILAPDAAVPSVSCALPSPASLVNAFPPQKPVSASAGDLLSSKSKAVKVACAYCKQMFGKQGIRNHEAKCADKYGTKPSGWQNHKHQPWDGGDYGGDDDYGDDNDWDAVLNSGFKGRKKTNSRTQPPPSATPSAAADAAQTPEQLLAKAEKELKALRKKHKALQPQAKPVLPSSSDSSSSSSSNSSPEKKKKKSQQKKKSGQSAAELRAKATVAAAAATAAEAAAAAAAAGKRKKKKNKKKEKKEKKNAKQDEDSSCNDDSSNSSDGSGDSSASGDRRRKKQRRQQMPSANPTDANRKSHKRRSAPTTGGALGWYINSRTDQAILEERARTNQRMYQLVHSHLRNWLSDFTFGCVGTRGPRCRPNCYASCYRQSTLRAGLLINVHKCPRIFIFIFIFYSYSYSYTYIYIYVCVHIYIHIHVHMHIHILTSKCSPTARPRRR